MQATSEVEDGEVYPLGCDGTGKDPHCATKTPHDHCCCGLAKATAAPLCQLCVLEDLRPTADYPSRRLNRQLGPTDDAYLRVVRAMYGEGLAGAYVGTLGNVPS